jgi:hypothetical protein
LLLPLLCYICMHWLVQHAYLLQHLLRVVWCIIMLQRLLLLRRQIPLVHSMLLKDVQLQLLLLMLQMFLLQLLLQRLHMLLLLWRSMLLLLLLLLLQRS